MPTFEKFSARGSSFPPYVKKKKSTIKGANYGVFATCDIPAGETLGEYLGVIVKGQAMKKRTGAYLFEVKKKGKVIAIIDGEHEKNSSWVRFVNTAQSYYEGNTKFYQFNERIFLKSTRLIPSGQELFAYYGHDYINKELDKYFTSRNKPKIKTEPTGKTCL